MAKSLLLSKVHDRSYSHIVDALMVSNDDYEDWMQRLLNKHNMLNQNKGNGASRNMSITNSSNRGKGKNSNNRGNSNSSIVVHKNNNKNNNVGSNDSRNGGAYRESQSTFGGR